MSHATILNAETLTTMQLRYWSAIAREYAGTGVVIDPARRPLRELRSELPAGTRVYRASTGGRWGKSKEIVTL